MKNMSAVLAELPPGKREEVYDFARFLVAKRAVKKHQKMTMKWAGGLKSCRKQYTSVGLQHKARKWWGNEISG
jgi:hypothetical protein